MRKFYPILIAVSLALVIILSGCGGGGGGGGNGTSSVSGTLADIDRNTITGGEVWVDDNPANSTESLASGAYRLDGVRSGWRTIRARAFINGEEWVGSTAVEVLRNEPTMNINIVLSPRTETTDIGGVVRDEFGDRIEGARVLFTTRIVFPPDQTSSDDGPYGSIVAVTNDNGQYLLNDVPVGVEGIVAASKVAYRNREVTLTTSASGDVVDFTLIPTDGTLKPEAPTLEAIESYTMPDTITTSSNRIAEIGAYKAIRAYISPNYKDVVEGKSSRITTQATPAGSLIEVDLYWNSLAGDNDSRDLAGYGIYRTTNPAIEMRSIDFVRDPYANFYGDMGTELTPYQNYYYAVTAVDVEFLDNNNNPIEDAESDKSNALSVRPLGQLRVTDPSSNAVVSQNPRFTWNSLNGAANYRIVIYDRFPVMSFTPVVDTSVSGTQTSFTYGGSELQSGETYYWVILANDSTGKAFSYSQIRRFTVD
ncbi:MAG: hypothetical protein ACYC27_17845 [Armatimonadota bacterium]